MSIDDHFPNLDWKPFTAWFERMTLEGRWTRGKLLRARLGDTWVYRLAPNDANSARPASADIRHPINVDVAANSRNLV
jgi:hypothetical protein